MNPKFVISKKMVHALAKKPHEPIVFNSESAHSKFLEEVTEKLVQLEEIISELGYQSNWKIGSTDEEYDVYFNKDVSAHRFLSFEIMDPKMESKNLILTISNWLASLDDDYTVFITNDYECSLDFYMMIVKAECVYGVFNGAGIADRFGFDNSVK